MLLDEAAAYLAGAVNGIGTYVASGVLPAGVEPLLLKGSLPSQPDKVLVLREYSAAPSDLGFGVPGIQFEYAGLQLVARGAPNDYEEPRLRIYRAYQEGAKVQARTLSGVQHLLWSPGPPPVPLDRDASNRFIFVCNFIVQKRPSAA